MRVTAEILLDQFGKNDIAKLRRSLVAKELPQGEYIKVDIAAFTTKIAKGAGITDCSVWIPAGTQAALQKIVTFAIYDHVANCDFIFFNIPDPRSRIVLSLKGHGHKAAFFSRLRQTFTAKMVHRDCALAIGDNTYIGGATLVLMETAITVGKGGLWSDGILLQGTDSHGIVDLDTMRIINGGPKSINIGRHVWLGRNSTVMKNFDIGAGSIVATGSIVVKNVPAASAVAGIPAKVVRSRVSWSQSQTSVTASETNYFGKLRRAIDTKPGTSNRGAGSAVRRILSRITSGVGTRTT